MKLAVQVSVFIAASTVWGQQGGNFQVTESEFNLGGNPGVVVTSPGFQVTLSALGGNPAAGILTSAAFQMDGGFVGSNPPPGEVAGVAFTDSQTLVWANERTAAEYNVYRAGISSLPGGFGSCARSGVAGESATFPANPANKSAQFSLVTAVNGLAEEGTKGFTSAGAARGNAAPCP